ncbi:nitrous oxide-stimulated promoter family protein [Treponema pectinovorum]
MRKRMTQEEILNKRQNEVYVCTLMIQIYCKGVHKNKAAMKGEEFLCPECKQLTDYVKLRVSKCPFMETKTFCAMCKVHCYKKDMREQIKIVMRYAGPRMLKYHPILALKHVYLTIQQKRKLKKEQ